MTPANLSVDERRGSDSVVLALTGELDIATVPELRTAVERCTSGGPGQVVLDFGGVTFCDSQGLSALIGLNKATASAGSELVLTNLGEFMVRLLDITGLRAAFTIA